MVNEVPLVMPKMSMTMTEGTFLMWHKSPGDQIHEGDVVCEVATDKVDMEVEATIAGTLTRLLAEPEDVVSVGEPLAYIATEAEELLGGLFDTPPPEDATSADEPIAKTAPPNTKASEPNPRMAQPFSQVTEPSTEIAEPIPETPEPFSQAVKPSAEEVEPIAEGAESFAKGVKTSGERAGSIAEVARPVAKVVEAPAERAKPFTEDVEASSEGAKPFTEEERSSAAGVEASGEGAGPMAEVARPVAKVVEAPAEGVDLPTERGKAFAEGVGPSAEGVKASGERAGPMAEVAKLPAKVVKASAEGAELFAEGVKAFAKVVEPLAEASWGALLDSSPSGSAPEGRAGSAPSTQAASAAPTVVPRLAAPDGPAAVPAARRLAAKRGIDLATVTATGPWGTIRLSDVDSAHRAVHRGRAAVARRMVASTQVPQFVLHRDLDLEAVERTHGWTVLLTHAFATALRRHPELNASWTDGAVQRHDHVGVALAVDTPRGLLAPVLTDPDRSDLDTLAARIGDMVARARAGRLGLAELSAPATTTVSNLGGFGITGFQALLTPPQATALAVGAVEPKVVPLPGGLGVRLRCTAHLSVDHRVADGADGARLLATLQELL